MAAQAVSLIFFSFAALIWLPLLSAQDIGLPGVTELTKRIEAIRQSENTDPAEKAGLIEVLDVTLERLKRADQYRAEAKDYRAVIATINQDTARLETRIANARPRVVGAELAAAPLNQIETALAEAGSAAQAARRKLTELESTLQSLRSERLQPLIDKTQDSLNSTRVDSIAKASVETSRLSDNAIASLALVEMQQARLAALEQRQASRPGRLSLLELEAEYLRKQVGFAEEYDRVLHELAAKKRASEARDLAEKSAQAALSLESAPEPLRDFSTGNVFLAGNLADLIERRQAMERQQEQFEIISSDLASKTESVTRLLDSQYFDASSAFGAALRRERDSAAHVSDSASIRLRAERALTDSRIALFFLEEQKPPFNATDEAMQSVQNADRQSPWASQVESLLRDRQRLLGELSSNHRRQIDSASAVLSQLERIAIRSTHYRELLESHLFWIPSADRFGFGSLKAAGKTLAWLQTPAHWEQVGAAVEFNLAVHLPRYVSGLLLLLATLWGRGALKRSLIELEPQVGKIRTDRFSLTIWAIGITFLLALPIPLLFFLLSDLTSSETGFSSGFSQALWTAALTLLFMECVLQLVRPKGLAELHFRWKPTTLGLVGRVNRWLIAVLIPTIIVMVLLDLRATPEIRDGLGRLTLVVLCLTIALVAYQMFKASRAQLVQTGRGAHWYLANVGYPLLIVEMFAIILLSLFGYHYSATQVLARVVGSLFLATTAILLYYVLARASSVYERRLALERLLAKRMAASAQNADRESAEQAGEAMPDVVDSLDIDRHTISQQTSTALRTTVWIGFVVAFAYTWRDLLPVARSLNDWVIWQVASDNPALQPQSITLWSLLLAASLVFVSVIAVKNLPGVLEVLVLSRLNLTPGTGYAVTTVGKYFIVIASALGVTNLLGADWSKLQWLIAALGVGLGFGLQEIVANFVSGIIILFEKPFRLGDTVTIDGQSGTITRIQIRATTISDWDRKELIIPNKSFVTKDFVNWTLSDATTRLVIPVGVAYGSDNQQVVATLLELSGNNAKVLDDPAPAALFLGFGDSALNFELRVFTRSISDRLVLTHELHLAIDQAFKERGIEISFPQRDLHLSSISPLEVIMKPPVER